MSFDPYTSDERVIQLVRMKVIELCPRIEKLLTDAPAGILGIVQCAFLAGYDYRQKEVVEFAKSRHPELFPSTPSALPAAGRGSNKKEE